MAKLVYVQLETVEENRAGVAWYAYFEGEPDSDDLDQVFDDPSKVCEAHIGPDFTYEEYRQEVPNPLSKHAGLRRWYVSAAG